MAPLDWTGAFERRYWNGPHPRAPQGPWGPSSFFGVQGLVLFAAFGVFFFGFWFLALFSARCFRGFSVAIMFCPSENLAAHIFFVFKHKFPITFSDFILGLQRLVSNMLIEFDVTIRFHFSFQFSGR